MVSMGNSAPVPLFLALVLIVTVVSGGSTWSRAESEAFDKLDAVISLIQSEPSPEERYQALVKLSELAKRVVEESSADEIMAAVGELMVVAEQVDAGDWAVGALGAMGNRARLAVPKIIRLIKEFQEVSPPMLGSPVGRVEAACISLSRIVSREELAKIAECKGWLE